MGRCTRECNAMGCGAVIHNLRLTVSRCRRLLPDGDRGFASSALLWRRFGPDVNATPTSATELEWRP